MEQCASAPLGREAPHIIADSKNDNHDITDLLLKVALNTQTLAIIIHMWDSLIHFSMLSFLLSAMICGASRPSAALADCFPVATVIGGVLVVTIFAPIRGGNSDSLYSTIGNSNSLSHNHTYVGFINSLFNI
jgi:hypothetical protein